MDESDFRRTGRNRAVHVGDIVEDFIGGTNVPNIVGGIVGGVGKEIGKNIGRGLEHVADEKKDQYLAEVEKRAFAFMQTQLESFDKHINQKITEIKELVENKVNEYEVRLDEQLEKELKIKLNILKWTFATAVGIMAIGFLFQMI